MAAGRLSYFFGFQGPCIAIDTACSSSLVALHNACQSLKLGESKIAVVAGVNYLLNPRLHIYFSKLKVLSKDGKCKAFDDSADGYVRGEGCGVIVLKTLEQAINDKNRILGIIKGSAINHNGASSSLTAPNGNSQEKVVLSALKSAKLFPSEINYVEAHGTGTALGDPIEVNSLNNAYGKNRSKSATVLIGSVKPNIGHLEAASGIASIIKTVLSINNGKIPASINYQIPNKNIPWNDLALKVNDSLTIWDVEKKDRTCGIHSFGFGGTNAHIILQGYEQQEKEIENNQIHSYLLVLSAKSKQSLKRLSQSYISLLKPKSIGALDLSNICYTSCAHRNHFKYRDSFYGANKEELLKQLGKFSLGKENNNKEFLFIFNDDVNVNQNEMTYLKNIEKYIYLFKKHPEMKSFYSLLDFDISKQSLTKIKIDFLSSLLQWTIAQSLKDLGVIPNFSLGFGKGELIADLINSNIDSEQSIKQILSQYYKTQLDEKENISSKGQNSINKKAGTIGNIEEIIKEKKIGNILNFGINNLNGSFMFNNIPVNSFQFLVQNDDSLRTYHNVIGKSYVMGNDIKWENLFHKQIPKIKLPNYPFEKIKHWKSPSEQILKDNNSKLIDLPKKQFSESNLTSYETILCKVKIICLETLGLPTKGIEALDENRDLFELGLDSLTAYEVEEKIENNFEINLPNNFLIENKSISALVNFLLAQKNVFETDLTTEASQVEISFNPLSNKKRNNQKNNILYDVQKILKDVLDIKSSTKIGENEILEHMGVDSLMVYEIEEKLNSLYNISFSEDFFRENNTPKKIVEYIHNSSKMK